MTANTKWIRRVSKVSGGSRKLAVQFSWQVKVRRYLIGSSCPFILRRVVLIIIFVRHFIWILVRIFIIRIRIILILIFLYSKNSCGIKTVYILQVQPVFPVSQSAKVGSIQINIGKSLISKGGVILFFSKGVSIHIHPFQLFNALVCNEGKAVQASFFPGASVPGFHVNLGISRKAGKVNCQVKGHCPVLFQNGGIFQAIGKGIKSAVISKVHCQAGNTSAVISIGIAVPGAVKNGYIGTALDPLQGKNRVLHWNRQDLGDAVISDCDSGVCAHRSGRCSIGNGTVVLHHANRVVGICEVSVQAQDGV